MVVYDVYAPAYQNPPGYSPGDPSAAGLAGPEFAVVPRRTLLGMAEEQGRFGGANLAQLRSEAGRLGRSRTCGGGRAGLGGGHI